MLIVAHWTLLVMCTTSFTYFFSRFKTNFPTGFRFMLVRPKNFKCWSDQKDTAQPKSFRKF